MVGGDVVVVGGDVVVVGGDVVVVGGDVVVAASRFSMRSSAASSSADESFPHPATAATTTQQAIVLHISLTIVVARGKASVSGACRRW